MPLDTFPQLMAIEPLNSSPTGIEGAASLATAAAGGGQGQTTFYSKRPAWPPGGEGAAFGGHVYAQSAWAAAQTVGKGMVIHAVNGHFTLPGQTDRPFVYQVTHTSQGSAYCTRLVTVRQPLEPRPSSGAPWPKPPTETIFTAEQARTELGAIVFVSLVSFKKDEPRKIAHQDMEVPWRKYREVINKDGKGTKPIDHIEAPNVDAPWYHDYQREYGQVTTFPGLTMRKVDMDSYNHDKPMALKRQLTFYRLYGSIPADEPNLYACAHLYASDRNGLFIISNWLGFGNKVTRLGSLSHSVVFHVGEQGLRMLDVDINSDPATTGVDDTVYPELADEVEESGKPLIVNGLSPSSSRTPDDDDGAKTAKPSLWFLQESWTQRGEASRGLVESRIWDARGVHIATTMQDGLVRGVDEQRRFKTQLETFQKDDKGLKAKI